MGSGKQCKSGRNVWGKEDTGKVREGEKKEREERNATGERLQNAHKSTNATQAPPHQDFGVRGWLLQFILRSRLEPRLCFQKTSAQLSTTYVNSDQLNEWLYGTMFGWKLADNWWDASGFNLKNSLHEKQHRHLLQSRDYFRRAKIIELFRFQLKMPTQRLTISLHSVNGSF